MKFKKTVCIFCLSFFFALVLAGCGAEDEKKPTPTSDEKFLDDLNKAKSEMQTSINQTKTHIQRKIPKSNVHVDMSTNKKDLVVSVDIKLSSPNVDEAKALTKKYVESLSDVPASVARYDFTFISNGKMVCMITKEKGNDKFSIFADDKSSEF